jgi:TIR domain
MSAEPLRVFVSHIHEEAALASLLKSRLEQAFGNQLKVFVSSDPSDNPGGDMWLDKLKEELSTPQTRMLIALISPASLPRHWISVELGAAWIRGLRVFPLCHSDISPSKLPRPMQDFGGASVDDASVGKRLIKAVSNATALPLPPLSQSDYELLFVEMRDAARRSTPSAPSLQPSVRDAQGIALTPDQERVLQLLHYAFDGGMPKSKLTDAEGGKRLGMPASDFRVHVNVLQKHGLVSNTVNTLTGISWYINDEGLKWVHDKSTAATSVPSPTEGTAVTASRDQAPTPAPEVELDNDEIKVLRLFAEQVDSLVEPRESLTLQEVTMKLLMKPSFLRLHIKALEQRGLMSHEIIMGEGIRYYITDDGLRWLKRGGLL